MRKMGTKSKLKALTKLTSVILLIVGMGLSAPVLAGELYLDGTFQGENIYMQNQYNSSTNSFCIKDVQVNGVPLDPESISSSAFEIDLSKFKMGDYVNIKITHKDYCKPRILNPEVLRTKSTYEIVQIKSEDNQLKWTTKNESAHEPFIVEQFRNNKWVPIAKVVGRGPEGFNNYSIEINHHSGLNKYRIKQKDLGNNKYRYSHPIEYVSNKPPITYYPRRIDKVLYLSEKTEYEIYDSFGRLVRHGDAQKIDVESLESGIYYLNIDNRTEKFLKK
jgi:hypothetical protein